MIDGCSCWIVSGPEVRNAAADPVSTVVVVLVVVVLLLYLADALPSDSSSRGGSGGRVEGPPDTTDRYPPVRELLREEPVRSVADLDPGDRGEAVAVRGTVAVRGPDARDDPRTFPAPLGSAEGVVLAGYAVDRFVAPAGESEEKFHDVVAYAGVMGTPFLLEADGERALVDPGNHFRRHGGGVFGEDPLRDGVEIDEVVCRFESMPIVETTEEGEAPPEAYDGIFEFPVGLRPPGNPPLAFREGVLEPGDEAVVVGYVEDPDDRPPWDPGPRGHGRRRDRWKHGGPGDGDDLPVIAPPADGGPLFVSNRPEAVSGAGEVGPDGDRPGAGDGRW